MAEGENVKTANTVLSVISSMDFENEVSSVETYSTEKDGILYVTLPYDYSTPFAVNSIPYAQIGWITETENGKEHHPAGYVWEVSSDGYELTDGTYHVKQTIEREYDSYLAVVVFTDNDETAYPEYKSDGTVHPLHPICIKSMDYVPVTPVASGSEDFPAPVQSSPGNNKKIIFAGWGDANTGTVYGENSPLTLRPRTLLTLKPIWKEVYADGRRATLVFRAGTRGSFHESDGITVLDSWTQKDDTYSLLFSENTDNSDIPFGEYAELGLKTLSFTIPQGLRYIPYAEKSNFSGYIGHIDGKDSIPRMILAWVRVDGGTLINPVNDTNHGFILSNSDSIDKRGIPEGDGFSDIYYPGDCITLDIDETTVLKPIWTYEYRYHLEFDLSQFYDLTDDTTYEDTEISERDYFYAQLKYWVERNNLTPVLENGVITKAYIDVSSSKNTYWMRIPPYMPPCATYFEAWIADAPMYDITGQTIYGNASKNSSENNNIVVNNPCPGQRVGFKINDGEYSYNCTFTAKWCDKNSSVAYIPVVYDDPDWAEPKISTVVGTKQINDNEIDMPLSRMVKSSEYASRNGSVVVDFKIVLDGTGRQDGEFIDTRPRGKGFNTIVKSFDHWDVRVDNTGTEQKFLPGDCIRIIFEGNVMAGYYWGDFPGPYSEHTVPKTISPAWKFFKTEEGIANSDPVYWQDIIFKKAIWGPMAQSASDSKITDVHVSSLPDVIYVNASWRTQTGAYLIFGDYTNQDLKSSSGIPPALELPCIQLVQDTVSNNLSEISTVTYGYENNFIMDLGTVRSFSLKISRINPTDYNDSYSIYDDSNFSVENDENGNEILYQNGVIVTNRDSLPQIANEFYYANHWSNSKWYYKLRERLNFWQNSVGLNRCSQYGGIQFFYSVPPIDIRESDIITISDDASSLRPFYPNMLYNVFVTGSISPTYSGQKMTLSIPLTLSKMVTTSKTESFEEKICCVFKPYDDSYTVGNREQDSYGRWYVDSINATDVLRATYRTSDTDWIITTPTSLSEWSGVRYYYESNDATEPVDSSTLEVYQWTVNWVIDGRSHEATVYAGETVDVGKAKGAVLTASWTSALETILMVADDGYAWRVNAHDSSRNIVLPADSDNSNVDCFPIPKNASRISVTMCGGGGAGGEQYPPTNKSSYVIYGGGGGAGGETVVRSIPLKKTDEVIAIYSGHGGARVSQNSKDGEDSFIAIGSKQQFEQSTRLNASNFNNVYGFSKTLPLYYVDTYYARGGQGGQDGDSGLGGKYQVDISNVANGGDRSFDTSKSGEDGGNIGSFKGGTGGASIVNPPSYYYGGGGGGASALELYVPYKVDWGGKLDMPTVKLGDTTFLSKGGRGWSSKRPFECEDGEYGGGGGGGRHSYSPNSRMYSYGGSGVVYVQFFAGGSN